MAKAKSRIPLFLAVPVILVGSCLGLSPSCTIIGNHVGSIQSDQRIDVEGVAKAFAAYTESHGGKYPTFKNANEITNILETLLSKEAAKKSDCTDLPYTTLARLEVVSQGAVWNTSLSGAAESDKKWIFYYPEVHNPDRFIVGYSNGDHTYWTKSQLGETVGKQGKN